MQFCSHRGAFAQVLCEGDLYDVAVHKDLSSRWVMVTLWYYSERPSKGVLSFEGSSFTEVVLKHEL